MKAARLIVWILLIAASAYGIYLEDQQLFYTSNALTALLVITFLMTIYMIFKFIRKE